MIPHTQPPRKPGRDLMEGRPHPPIRPESRRPIAIEATAPTQTRIPRITRILVSKSSHHFGLLTITRANCKQPIKEERLLFKLADLMVELKPPYRQ